MQPTQIEGAVPQKLMNSRDFIREVVLRTNPYRPFSSLNKVPYKLAISAFRRLCGRFPEITSAYVRGSLVDTDWVPALSDIDLTIIIDDQLGLDEEYSFLRSFWETHRQLKRIFPMLGEIEIFNKVELGIITRFGLLGHNSVAWQRIYGKEVRNLDDARTNLTRSYVHPINYALQFYLEPFLRRIAGTNGESYLGTADLGRLAAKIIRTLDPIGPRRDIQHLGAQLGNKTTLLDLVVRRLDESVSISNQRQTKGEPGKKSMLFHDISATNNANFEHLDFDRRWREQIEKSVDGIVLNYRREGYIVLRNGSPLTGLQTLFVEMRGLLGMPERNCTIVTQRIFEHMLRHFNPFLYSQLMENRSVLWGRDVLSGIEPPDEHCFENFLLSKVKNVLHFPRNSDLVAAETCEIFTSTSLGWVMNIAPVIKLYLEKEILIPCYRKAWLEGRRQYPEYENSRRELWERSSEMNLESLGWEWYRLLKTIGNDIQKSLANTNVEAC